MHDFDDLRDLVSRWAECRGIIDSTPFSVKAQLGKVAEELGELTAAYNTLVNFECVGNDQLLQNEVELELGDVFVTLIVTSECMGIDPLHAMHKAYEKIKNRKGKMVGGVFVKETTND